MWTYEHTLDTIARPEQLWRLYADVRTWPTWDHAFECVTIDGPFVPGSAGQMKVFGQDPLPFVLVDVQPERYFVDQTDLGDVVLRFEHVLEPGPNGTRLTHRVQISGPVADEVGPKLGPQVTADIPRTMSALAAEALATATV